MIRIGSKNYFVAKLCTKLATLLEKRRQRKIQIPQRNQENPFVDVKKMKENLFFSCYKNNVTNLWHRIVKKIIIKFGFVLKRK